MNQQRPLLRFRIMAYAQRNPRRYGVITGVLSGIFFGGCMTLFAAFFLLMVGDSVLWALLPGAASSVLFGLFIGVLATMSVPSTPLPPGTDPTRMREAWRLVRSGAPGSDPEVNQAARYRAEAVVRTQYWPKTMASVFTLGIALQVWVLADSTRPLAWVNFVGIALFSTMLFVILPITARDRRRAKAFLEASARTP